VRMALAPVRCLSACGAAQVAYHRRIVTRNEATRMAFFIGIACPWLVVAFLDLMALNRSRELAAAE